MLGFDTRPRVPALAAALAAALLLPAGPAKAQLPSPNAAALGMGGNYTAIARGYAAAAWNPAGLASRQNPGFSLALLPVGIDAAIGPLTLGDFQPYADAFVPPEVRAEWLDRIARNGGVHGTGGGDVTYLALNMGPVGIQVGSRIHARLDFAPDAAELVLFGNAGRTGQPRDFEFAGSAATVSATSTAALSYAAAIPLGLGPLPDQRFAIGATLKYTVGHALLSGRDEGSTLSSDPLAVAVALPVLYTDPDAESFDNGRGIGVDVGALWEAGPFAVAVAVQNVVNTFRWDESKLVYRTGSALFAADTSASDFKPHPFADAPQSVRARLDDLGYEPLLVLGAAVRPSQQLTVTAELRRQIGEGLELGQRTHAGIGVELRPIPLLPLRAGITAVSGGMRFSGGLGLELGPIELAASAAYPTGDLGSGAIGMFGLSFGGT